MNAYVNEEDPTPTTPRPQGGFTLIELSIVLVIIGLIVGGVLVGQDLIKAAEVRAGVGQIEKYEAAANTFRSKYNGLPGDIPNAGNFGLTTLGVTGNGNGVLGRTADDANDFDGESAAFFRHLAQTNLVADSITGADFTAANVNTVTAYVPASKMGRGVLVMPYGSGGLNYYSLGVMSVAAGQVTMPADDAGMAVIDAFNFDTKLDDGNPSTGKVISETNMLASDGGDAGAAAGTANSCKSTGGTADPAFGDDSYQTSTQQLYSDTECFIRIRASF